jgi:cation-transporting ATPase V/Cu+-exporting ATPase
MTCGSCAARVQRVLARQPAVTDAEVNFATGRARVRTEGSPDVAALQAAVERIGYRIQPVAEGRPAGEHDAEAAAQRSWLRRVVAVAPAAAFAVGTMLLVSCA